jgi:hypothetical protein
MDEILKRIAILQSNYIPWKGYFDIIKKSDLFIFHDDLQYTKGDWRNRNKIKTSNGLEWLTVPCGSNDKRLICEVKLTDDKWQKQHWMKIVNNYSKTPFFKEFNLFFEEFYLAKKWEYLHEFNQSMIIQISQEIFKFDTTFDDSKNYSLTEAKSERVLELLIKANATDYITGPAAKNYLNEDLLSSNGINLHWMDYSSYREYPQLHPPFEHTVTILDFLFNNGLNDLIF